MNNMFSLVYSDILENFHSFLALESSVFARTVLMVSIFGAMKCLRTDQTWCNDVCCFISNIMTVYVMTSLFFSSKFGRKNEWSSGTTSNDIFLITMKLRYFLGNSYLRKICKYLLYKCGVPKWIHNISFLVIKNECN